MEVRARVDRLSLGGADGLSGRFETKPQVDRVESRQHLSGPNQPALQISSASYATTTLAHNAMVLASRVAGNLARGHGRHIGQGPRLVRGVEDDAAHDPVHVGAGVAESDTGGDRRELGERALQSADSTGETVFNPRYETKWRVRAPAGSGHDPDTNPFQPKKVKKR